MLFSILIAVMVVLGLVLVAIILLQQGKGADAGAAFGSGASGTVFGSRGSGSFLGRLTGVLMAVFMILALVMAWLGRHGAVKTNSVMSGAAASATVTQPAPAMPAATVAPRAGASVAAPASQSAPTAGTGSAD